MAAISQPAQRLNGTSIRVVTSARFRSHVCRIRSIRCRKHIIGEFLYVLSHKSNKFFSAIQKVPINIGSSTDYSLTYLTKFCHLELKFLCLVYSNVNVLLATTPSYIGRIILLSLIPKQSKRTSSNFTLGKLFFLFVIVQMKNYKQHFKN